MNCLYFALTLCSATALFYIIQIMQIAALRKDNLVEYKEVKGIYPSCIKNLKAFLGLISNTEMAIKSIPINAFYKLK